LFLHDLSEFNEELEIDERSGLFEMEEFDWFFEKEGLTPYFIVHEGKRIGFMLLQSGPFVNKERYDYLVHSFFLLRKYRRKGLGKQACVRLFDQLPGRYAIGQLSNNEPAVAFWKNVYRSMGIDYEEREELEEGHTILYQYFTV